jgi:hypothetical protein
VISYNISRPMSLDSFQQLPEHAKKEYFQVLRKNGGGAPQIAEMFGCEIGVVLDLMKQVGARAGGRRIDDADFLWSEFVKGYKAPETPQKAPETSKAEDVPEPPPAPEVTESPGTETAVAFTQDIAVSASLRAFRVDLTGPMDGVLAKLQTFTDLIGRIPVRVTISVDEEG